MTDSPRSSASSAAETPAPPRPTTTTSAASAHECASGSGRLSGASMARPHWRIGCPGSGTGAEGRRPQGLRGRSRPAVAVIAGPFPALPAMVAGKSILSQGEDPARNGAMQTRSTCPDAPHLHDGNEHLRNPTDTKPPFMAAMLLFCPSYAAYRRHTITRS